MQKPSSTVSDSRRSMRLLVALLGTRAVGGSCWTVHMDVRQTQRTRLSASWRSGSTHVSASMGTGSWEVDLFSPAKLILYMRVLGRGDDGLHKLSYLSQAVDVGDRLLLARVPATRRSAAGVVRPSRATDPIKQHGELSISPANAGPPCDETNLVYRALDLFRTRCSDASEHSPQPSPSHLSPHLHSSLLTLNPHPQPQSSILSPDPRRPPSPRLAQRDGGSLEVPRFRAHLVKRIPPRAGLSSAASNAATALYGANELCGRPASPDELIEWSARLGSDVACLLGASGTSTCDGDGIFHRVASGVREMPPLICPSESGRQLFIVTPSALTKSTPRLFRTLADSGYSDLHTEQPAELLREWSRLVDQRADATIPAVNDLQQHAFECVPELEAIRNALCDEGFDTVLLSGAGNSLFAIGMHPDATAHAFAKRFEKECNESIGVPVHVWPARFSSRGSCTDSQADGERRPGSDWYTEGKQVDARVAV